MSNTERFYAWMKSINNIHIGDNEAMARAFYKVALGR